MAEPVVVTAMAAAAGLLGCAMALAVLAASPRAPTNRVLSAILALEGAAQLSVFLPSGGEGLVAAAEGLFAVPFLLLPPLYLLFLSRLDTPLAAPLRRARRGLRALLAVVAVLLLAGLAQLALGSDPGWLFVLFLVAMLAFGVVSVYGLVVALSMWRRAPPRSLARERAGAYALAFGARDALVALAVVAFFIEEAVAPKEGVHVPAFALAGLATLAFVPLLAYGVLRGRLVGVEARVRWTISRGTVAVLFVAVFVAASQGTAAVVAPRWGTAAGVTAAALLVLALVPIQRLAERIAARAVPDASASTTLLDARRLEVYQAALEELAPEGEPRDDASARYLEALRGRLGLTATDHAVLARVVRGRAPAAALAVVAPGARLLDRFQVVRALREGGEARTFLAEDLHLQRTVVLKVTRPSGAPEKALREARALAALRHPNVAIVHDALAVGDTAMLVIEHVEGGSLRDRLARGPLGDEEWRLVARGVLAALEEVHGRGLVHGDVKPGNVLLARDGTTKLADFGLARLVDDDATRTAGGAAGTPRYMSPEQARGAPTSPRSDLYAAALTLAEARHGRAEAPTPDDPLAAWFRRAIEPAPSRRFESARAMAEAMEAALAAAPPTRAQRS